MALGLSGAQAWPSPLSVLPLSSAPEGRGADGVDAMAEWVT
jgi:hypothetical protein